MLFWCWILISAYGWCEWVLGMVYEIFLYSGLVWLVSPWLGTGAAYLGPILVIRFFASTWYTDVTMCVTYQRHDHTLVSAPTP